MYAYNKQLGYLNKAIEMESKLLYYVNVELDLYPGTSVNPLQKTAALCSSRFERIREAVAKIRGVQFRPVAIEDAYGYQNETKETNGVKGTRETNGVKGTRETNEFRGFRGGKNKKIKTSLKNLKFKKNNSIRNNKYKK